ncbi:MAG: hypothetical protein KC502_14055 [Myxococcales bacterium]|nr:hypothetical protein [Myxococcales bacterium]
MLEKLRGWLIPTFLLTLALGAWWLFSPHQRWLRGEPMPLRPLVLDYTVPYDNYKEHAGFTWLLNNLKASNVWRLPGQWNAARDYRGYSPVDRAHPKRLNGVDFRSLDLVYIADTYGVYMHDVFHANDPRPQLAYSPLVFGGLSNDDAVHLTRFVASGGYVMGEFNTFADPTSPEVRAQMQRLFGVEWSGWVGRVFLDPHDPGDVPFWLPVLYARQHDGAELPRSPILALISQRGDVRVFKHEQLGKIAPRLVLTERGRNMLGDVDDGAPYYYWFGLMHAPDRNTVLARFDMPASDDLTRLLQEIRVDPKPPLLVVRARTAYFAADLADIDFELDGFASTFVADRNRLIASRVEGMTSYPAYWRFYVPAMKTLLRKSSAHLALN